MQLNKHLKSAVKYWEIIIKISFTMHILCQTDIGSYTYICLYVHDSWLIWSTGTVNKYFIGFKICENQIFSVPVVAMVLKGLQKDRNVTDPEDRNTDRWRKGRVSHQETSTGCRSLGLAQPCPHVHMYTLTHTHTHTTIHSIPNQAVLTSLNRVKRFGVYIQYAVYLF